MTREESQVMEGLRQLARDASGGIKTRVAKVTAVDLDAYTCTVMVNDDSVIEDVRLRSVVNSGSPCVMIPKVQTYVLIVLIEDGTDWAVIAFDQVDKVIWNADQMTFNGGSNDGLVKVKELTTKLNNIENLLNALIGNFNSHTHMVTIASFGTPTPSVTPLPTEGQTLTPTQQGDIEDTKIKH